jgi:hypothetical protein
VSCSPSSSRPTQLDQFASPETETAAPGLSGLLYVGLGDPATPTMGLLSAVLPIEP